MAPSHVLIVDHDATTPQLFEEARDSEDMVVWWLQDGNQALSFLHTTVPDVLFLALWLPGMDGIELLQLLRGMGMHIPIVMLSGYGTIATALKALHLGAFDYLEKPLLPARLRHTTQRALRCKRHAVSRQSAHVVLGESPQVHLLRARLRDVWTNCQPVLMHAEPGSESLGLARLMHTFAQHEPASFVMHDSADLSVHDIEYLLGQRDTREAAANDRASREYSEARTIFLHGMEGLPPEMLHRVLPAMAACTAAESSAIPAGGVAGRVVASCTLSPERLWERSALLPETVAALRRVTIEVPPLRMRALDIPLLVRHFLHLFASQCGRPEYGVTPQAMARLCDYAWPGNTEELQECMRGLMRHCPGPHLGLRQVSDYLQRWRSRASELPYGGGVAWSRPRRPGKATEPGSRSAGAARRSQRTIRHSVTLYGQGLQSGAPTAVILAPLPPHSGIVFRNIVTGESLSACIAHVESTALSTCLRKGEVVVKTVEHLLSAIHAYGIANLLVTINDEIPIMDGSAAAFCRLFDDAGLVEQDAPAEEFVVDRCYHVGGKGAEDKAICLEPYTGFKVTYRLVYPPPLGVQVVTYEHRDGAGYRQSLAPARTFAFLRDVETLHDQDLMAGGRLNNVILLDAGRIINRTALRFPDECARHKILDIMGDLCLLGRPIRGHVRANMTGHTENVALVTQLHDAIYTGKTQGGAREG